MGSLLGSVRDTFTYRLTTHNHDCQVDFGYCHWRPLRPRGQEADSFSRSGKGWQVPRQHFPLQRQPWRPPRPRPPRPSRPPGSITVCGFKQGAEECYDKVQTVVGDSPREQCSLEPQRTCKHVTKLVPKLTPTEECVDVPKEVCTRSRTNPRKVKKPVVKKWCSVPSEESGLA